MIRAICVAPAVALFSAFWLLPLAKLAWMPASQGFSAYFIVLTEPAYLKSLVQTLLLSMAVVAIAIPVGACVGLSIGRRNFVGKKLLTSVLTMPLSFSGVIIGFFVLIFGGRTGILTLGLESFTGERVSFAYGLAGMFIGYFYFSLPRAILSFAAAAETVPLELEEAVRSFGGSTWDVMRDVWIPYLAPTASACGAIMFAIAMGAFGTAYTLASRYEVLPVTVFSELTNHANFATAASLSLGLGLVTWLALMLTPQRRSVVAAGGA